MAYFDRFDICEAYLVLEWDYNEGGWLHERPSNRRRREATHVQTHRIRFKPSPMLGGFESLSDNGKEIYSDLVDRYHLPVDSNEELIQWRNEVYS